MSPSASPGLLIPRMRAHAGKSSAARESVKARFQSTVTDLISPSTLPDLIRRSRDPGRHARPMPSLRCVKPRYRGAFFGNGAAPDKNMPHRQFISAPPTERRARRGRPLTPAQSSFHQEADPPRRPILVVASLIDPDLSARVRAYVENTPGLEMVPVETAGRPVDVSVIEYRPPDRIAMVHGFDSARPIALTGQCTDAALIGALQDGAWALLPTRASSFEFLAAVRQVAGGRCPILAEIANRPSLAHDMRARLQATAAWRSNPLSAREAAILAHVASGAKNGVIGAIFGLSEQTVKNYLSGILKKTGTGNRAEAAAIAVRNGWVTGHGE